MNVETKWISTDKHVYGAIYREHHEELGVFSSFTDNEGQYGEPMSMTEWGFRAGDVPIIKSEKRFGETIPGTKRKKEIWTYFIAINSIDCGCDE